jgi:hypothetical protein
MYKILVLVILAVVVVASTDRHSAVVHGKMGHGDHKHAGSSHAHFVQSWSEHKSLCKPATKRVCGKQRAQFYYSASARTCVPFDTHGCGRAPFYKSHAECVRTACMTTQGHHTAGKLATHHAPPSNTDQHKSAHPRRRH